MSRSGSDISLNRVVTDSSASGSRMTEIAIQANSDELEGPEEQVTHCFDFSTPFLFSDALIVVQGKRLHCHRAILSIFSPVFRAMFERDFKENSNNIVSMPEDNVDDVRAMLEHIYTPGGRDMTSESAHRLLPLVHRYQIESLVGEAERMITFNMTDSMAPANLKLADLYGLKRLRQTAIDSCARLDAVRLKQLLDEVKMPTDLRVEILDRRIMLLEKCLNEIQRSFTHSCVRMESRLERVPANHCSEHSRPLSVVSPQSSPQPLLVVSSAAGGLSALVPHGPAPPGLPITGRPLSSGSQEPYFGSAQITGMRSSLNNGTSAVTAPGIEINEVVDAAGLPHRMNVAASIQPISSMSGVLELRPLPSSISNPASQNTSSEATRATTVNVPGPVGVCEKCVEQFKVHINELCKRAMHKVPVVLYKQQ